MRTHRYEEQGAHKHEKEVRASPEQRANLEQQDAWRPSARRKTLQCLRDQPERGQTLSQQ